MTEEIERLKKEIDTKTNLLALVLDEVGEHVVVDINRVHAIAENKIIELEDEGDGHWRVMLVDA